MIHSLLYFIAAAAIFTVTPGIDTAMVLRSSLQSGRKAGMRAAAGICCGLLLWGIASAVGLTALLSASQLAFTIVKWCGAAYLMYLGARLLLAPRTSTGSEGQMPQAPPEQRNQSYLARGILTNVLNPKVGLFYMTFLPQFIPRGVPTAKFSLLLASVHVSMTFLWFALLAVMMVPFSRFLAKPTVVRTMDRITGGIFISFAFKLAFSESK